MCLLVGSISTWLAADVVQGVKPSSLPPLFPPSSSLPSSLSLSLPSNCSPSCFLSLLFHFFMFPFLFLFLFLFLSFLSFFPSLAASWTCPCLAEGHCHPGVPVPSPVIRCCGILALSPACRRWDRSGDALAASGMGTAGREQARFGGTGGVSHTQWQWDGMDSQTWLVAGVSAGVRGAHRAPLLPERSCWRQEEGGGLLCFRAKKADNPPKPGFPTGSASADSRVSPRAPAPVPAATLVTPG